MNTIGRVFTTLFGGILAFLSGCAGRAAAYMGPPPRSRARVQDSKTGKPVAGLRVELLREGKRFLITKTGKDGSFPLPRANSSGYTVKITDIDDKKNGEYKQKMTEIPARSTITRFFIKQK